jgi:urease alpha subunit
MLSASVLEDVLFRESDVRHKTVAAAGAPLQRVHQLLFNKRMKHIIIL